MSTYKGPGGFRCGDRMFFREIPEVVEVSIPYRPSRQRHPDIQALFDRMLAETMAEDRVWTGAEWRAAVTEIAERVPALKLVLADADESWTNDQWFEAVDRMCAKEADDD